MASNANMVKVAKSMKRAYEGIMLLITRGNVRLMLATGSFKGRRLMVELFAAPRATKEFVLRWTQGTSVDLYLITGKTKAKNEYDRFATKILDDTLGGA